MSISPGKRVLKWTILLLPWLLVLGLAAGWGLSAWTPGYLEQLVPRLAGEMGLPLTEFHIRDAGLFSADVGPVRLGEPDSGLRLDNVRVEYTPGSLRAGRVSRVVISGAVLDARLEGGEFTLPVLDLLPKGDGSGTAGPVPELPLDKLSLRDSRLRLDWDGRLLDIPFSADLTPGPALEFSGELALRDQPVTVTGSLGPTLDDLAVALSAKGFRLGSLADLLPRPVTGNADLALKGTVTLSRPETLRAEAALVVRDLAPCAAGVALDPATPLAANATIAGTTLDLALGPVALAAPQPATLRHGQARITPDGANATLTLDTAGVSLPVSLDVARADAGWQFTLDAANPDPLRVDTGGRAIRLGGLTLKVEGTASTDGDEPSVTATVETSTRSLALDGTGLRTGRIGLTLPLAWPAPGKNAPGRLTTANIRYGKHALGSLWAKLRQEGMGIGLDGTLSSELLPGLRVALDGFASMEKNEAHLNFDIGRYALTDAFDPASLVPALKDVTLTGNLTAGGGIAINGRDVDSRLETFLTDGTLDYGEDGPKVRGIRLYFESPDLLDFRSSPAQVFAFESASAGPMTINNGVVAFQVERRGVVLVERARFDWCGGHVESRSFRVVPGNDEYDVTLFCSDLRLTDLLQQLSLAKAKGDSALSGELPVTWKNGKISFHHGFLHSTPGQGGTIQVEAMQDLLASIPKGSPQRGQLELARAAIRDFEYKWVRLKADSVGDNLLVRLSVDGKPASTLPFVYRKEFGGFAMVEGDVKGSNFEGIRLDVNFSLPMDRILLYKNLMKRIQ